MTLVEVLVASVILGIGVTGLMSAATMSMRNQQRAEQRAAALYIAQQKLAEVDLIGAHVWLLARPMTGTEEAGPVSYSWSLHIEQEQVGELFRVQIEVAWSGNGGGSVELETWLNDYEAKNAAQKQNPSATPEAPNNGPPR